MANLSSRTGLSPVQTTIALANNTATTIQSFAAYDAQELIGHVFVDATTDYRAAVKVTVVKNGAGTYEVAASDVAGDDLSGSPIVTFAMSGSNLQATLPNFTGFASAHIKYHLVSPVTNANYPLSIDGGQILSGTVAFARLPQVIGQAYLSANSSAAADNAAIVPVFDVQDFGVGVSLSAGGFTPPAGTYRVTASLWCESVTANSIRFAQMEIRRGGTRYSATTSAAHATTAYHVYLPVFSTIVMTVDGTQKIDVRCISRTTSGNWRIHGSSDRPSYLLIERIY